MEAPHLLPNGSSEWEDVQLVGGLHRVYPCHVCMVPGEYVGVCRQCLLQLSLLFFGQQGTGIGTPVRSANYYGCDTPKTEGPVDYPSTRRKSTRLVSRDTYLSKNGHLGPYTNAHQNKYPNYIPIIQLL